MLVTFPLNVTSDYSVIQCSSTWTLPLDVLQNPEVDIDLCGGHLCRLHRNPHAAPVAGTGQGGLTYAWTNVDDPEAFDIANCPTVQSTNISVLEDGSIPTKAACC